VGEAESKPAIWEAIAGTRQLFCSVARLRLRSFGAFRAPQDDNDFVAAEEIEASGECRNSIAKRKRDAPENAPLLDSNWIG
jgi:hypothetical protein